ncbi:hypothetical protein [Polymorphospora lycopeni]|uniref:Uncharacterized protein n=1 Tax=Polymorphospora lycopeni TaxID=3140240 RepID=A0ABV5CW65_9ACTN
MRRLLAAATLAATLLLGAGCSGDEPAADPSPGGTGSATPTAATPSADPTGTPSVEGSQPGSAPAPGTSVAPAGGNAREVCETASKAAAGAADTYITQLGAMMQATASGDTAAADAARTKAEAALKSWSGAMREQAGRATDARLKAVLGEIATEVDSMKADVTSVDGMKLDELQQRLDALCGN